LFVGPGRQVLVFRRFRERGDVTQTQRRPVLVGDNQVAVFGGSAQLIIRIDSDRMVFAVKATF
jgi:hypothetical protein